MESKITKAAVGRFARIGEVYDERKDEFLSVNILTGSLTENDIFEDEANNVNVDFIVSDSISEKYEKLGIDAELSLSILSGLVKVSGSAAYLYDQKSSARTERMTLAYAVRTVHQELDGIRGKIDKDSLDAVEATHVVIGIDWGAKCNVTCEYENTENEEDTQVKGKLRAEIEKLKDIISLKGEANLDMKKNDRGKGNKFSFHSKCDVSDMDKDIPSSFEAAVKMATSLPSVVKKTNGGKGVPISYTMMSLATLRKMCKMQLKTGVICKKIEEDLVQRCLETMEDVTKTRQKIADLVSTVSENQDAALEDDIAKAQDLQKNFTRSEVKFKAKLMEKLVAVRSDELKTTALAKTLNDFLGDQNSPANASKEIGQFSTLSAKFKLVGHLKRRKVLYLGRNAMYEMALQQNSKKKLYLLYLRYSMKLSDPMKWRQETDLFFRLLLAHNEDNEFQFIVVDCEVQADAETRMHIEFYDKGVLCLEDVLKEEGQDLENCTIKVENLQPLKHKPIKRVVLEIPCPKSFSGRCSTDNCQWICRSCKELIEYGIDDTHFYCKCGGGSCYSAVFQCNDNKHGLGYVLYPKDILRKVLDQLRMAKEINILILGETGVGKSTWINALANYLAFSSLAEAKDAEEMKVLIPSQFSYTSETGTAQEILVGEKSANEVLNAGQSATQGPKAYKFTVGKQVISLIDTPGIGDVRGLEQDEKNFEKILAHLSYYDEIHGICILLKPNDSRLTVTFRFCITELLLHLHKSAAENIIFCFTNARSTFYRPGDTLPILKKLISEYKGATVSVTPNNLFCFDNEAFRFLACLKNGVRFGEQDIQTYSSSWERAVGETEKLFKHIVQLKPHSVQHTVSLNNARRIILELSKPLAETAANVQINIDAAERKTKELKASKETASELKDKLYLDAIDLKSVGLDYPRTVCTDSSCVEYVHVVDNTQKTVYKQHCHPHCYLSGVPTESINNTTLQGCAAMGGWPDYNCNQCGHSWRIHMHMTYDLERVNKRVIDNRVKILLDEKNDDASKLQCFITKVNSYVEELKQEQRQITDICAQFGCYLKKNAITPFNDEVDAHLQMLIKQEETKPDRSQKTIENLTQMRRKYDQKKQIITAAMENPNAKDNDFISEPGKVEELKKKLFALKHNGKQLEESFKTIQKAHSQYAHHEVQSMQIQMKKGSQQQGLLNSLKGAFSTGIKMAKNYLSLP